MSYSFLPKNIYWLLFSLLGIVYVFGLFVPLLDSDSAHHANIALHMYLTGDYVNLIDNGKDYLDKPHLLFWLSAASYHLFGVTSFAYKLPSFLFTILGTYSTYRLGKTLYNNEVGKLAALIVASAFAYMLANNDVRMEAVLTASVVFATWQLTEWVNRKSAINAIGAALGLAAGFCTKGHIAVFTPVIGIFFYILYTRNWKSFYHWQLLVIVLAFFAFISPVVYCYYLQYDLHPEKLIRGQTGRSGVLFILWDQNFERFKGESFGNAGKNDWFFFFHSFLWAFAPWSIVAYVAFFSRVKSFIKRKNEWLTLGTFGIFALIISFSGFKLPHYLNIIFPVTAVLTASYLVQQLTNPKIIKRLYVVQLVIAILCVLLVLVINAWSFPIQNVMIIAGGFALLAGVIFYLWRTKNRFQKLVFVSVSVSILVFYLLNTNFYPQLLTYQGGNEIAASTKGKVDTKNVYYWPPLYNHSYIFYTAELRKDFTDSLMQQNGPVWILTETWREDQLKEKGLSAIEKYAAKDYNISTLKWDFINPTKRNIVLDSVLLIRVK